MLLNELYNKNEKNLQQALHIQSLLKQVLENGMSLTDDIINCNNAYIYYTTLLNICQKCLNFLYYFISNVQCYIWFYSCRESYITTIFFN